MTFIPLEMTEGARRVLETDPHGVTLTIISVSVVFFALLILFGLYSLSGNIFTGKFRKKPEKAPASGAPDGEIAAAIAMALELEDEGPEKAAIAMALHLHLQSCSHDVEPGIITIAEHRSGWNDKKLTFRKSPQK